MFYLKVSIIIPVYNVEQYIVDCLQSVMCQTYQGPLECILVDDCGTDNSMAIAEELIAGYEGPIEFKILHHERNRGLSAARNTGMDAARGDFVYFLDSDDFIDNDTLEIHYKAINSGDYVISIGYFTAHSKGVDSVYKSQWVFGSPRIIAYNQFAEMILTQQCNHAATSKLYRKKILQNIRFREGRINEDTLFSIDLVQIIEENKYSCIDIPLYSYHYRMRDESICHQSVFRMYIAYVEHTAIAIDRYRDRPELASWLKKDQMRYAFGAIRNKDIDKKSFFAVSEYIRAADNKTIREVTSKKGYVRMMLVKYLPHIMWILGRKLNVI